MTTTATAEPRAGTGLKCEGGRGMRGCGKPAFFATKHYADEYRALCKLHARYVYTPVEYLSDDIVAAIATRVADHEAREAAEMNERRAKQRVVREGRVAQAWSSLAVPITSTLIVESYETGPLSRTGPEELQRLTIAVHAEGERFDSFGAFRVELEMEPDYPFTVRVRNGDGITPAAIGPVVQAIAQMGAWANEANQLESEPEL